MSSQTPSLSPFRRLYYKWRSLRLPWRKRHLVGTDLTGNTFWEFRDTLSANRFRRIVKYKHAPHPADVKISPQWHQWLRHTRADAPSLTEQTHDIQRLAQIQQLARLADERWASKPSFLDAPKDGSRTQPSPATEPRDPEGYKGVSESGEGMEETKTREKGREDPWGKGGRSGGPSERWQPEAWDPNKGRR